MAAANRRRPAADNARAARDRERHLPGRVRKVIDTAALDDALASFDEDVAEGRYAHADVLWRATLKRASEISRARTRALGCRTLDVLHVATAVELGLRVFVTFDRRQRQLAKSCGLRPVTPGARG
jgi:hypothetical protein